MLLCGNGVVFVFLVDGEVKKVVDKLVLFVVKNGW